MKSRQNNTYTTGPPEASTVRNFSAKCSNFSRAAGYCSRISSSLRRPLARIKRVLMASPDVMIDGRLVDPINRQMIDLEDAGKILPDVLYNSSQRRDLPIEDLSIEIN